MDELNAVFISLGFTDVTSLIASGNVVFTASEASEASEAAITGVVEDGLARALGYRVHTMLRTLDDLQAMIEGEPFANIDVQKQTRRYVTFLPAPTASALPLPYQSVDGSFRILSRTEREVFSVLTLSEGGRTVDAMAVLEKEYGKVVTTRNWNTILKLPRV